MLVPRAAASAGATLRGSPAQKNAVDFAVRSRGATAMSLLLARAPREGSAEGQGKPSGCLEIALDPVINRTGDLWHICVEVQPHRHAHVRYLRLPGSLAWPLCCEGRPQTWVAMPAGAEGSGDAVLCLEGGCRGGLGRRWPILPRCSVHAFPRTQRASRHICYAVDPMQLMLHDSAKSPQSCSVCKRCLQMCSNGRKSARNDAS